MKEKAIFLRDLKGRSFNWLLNKYGADGLHQRLAALDTDELAETFALYLKALERELPAVAIEQNKADTARQVIEKHIGGGSVADTDEIDYCNDGDTETKD